MKTKKCVITGVGPVTPIGIGKEEFWQSLVERRTNYCNISRVKLEEWDRVRIAAEINNFDPQKYVNKKVIESIDHLGAQNGGLSIYYGIAAAKLALQDADLNLEETDREHVAVIVGSGSGDIGLLQSGKANFTRGVYSLSNSLSGIISKELDLHGIGFAVSAACATGNMALRAGYQEILNGEAEVAIVGSSDAPINIPHFLGTEDDRKKGAIGLSQRNDRKRGMIPFDTTRDGIILAEGAGVLILEDLEHALTRNAHIYSEVIGFGNYTDFDTNLIRVTERGYYKAMEKAIHNSGLKAGDMRAVYINAHGTATPLNDPTESRAIEHVFGKGIPVSSFKGTTGHAQAAAPAIELIGCSLILDQMTIPPTNLQERASDCAPLDYVTSKREEEIEIIFKNAAGFNGVYSCCVMKKYKR